MSIVTVSAESGGYNQDETMLVLYSLAGEESGTFVTFRPHFLHRIGSLIFHDNTPSSAAQFVEEVNVRELVPSEMIRAEKELWINYHQQKADPGRDRLFAAFAGTQIIGVARCARHEDGLEVDAVYVLEDYRLKGFARSVMMSLISECGKNETLFMHSKIDLMDFYGSIGFYPIPEADLPPSIRDRFDFCMGNLKGIDVCPMRRDPGPYTVGKNT
ncbi:MAG: GNAT family N-acetyltransferase [Methanoregula sp.]|nr:GNAT family N-acetyltransferase [Methanoregula sp.]